MRYRFLILDVFTDVAFGGNQLAVLPDARGIRDDAMQAIAREFDFPESTFVVPPIDPGCVARVRIFTPRAELPFAGHPTVGTACALALEGRFGAGERHEIALEEGVGAVAVAVDTSGGALSATLSLDAPLERAGRAPDSVAIARVIGLAPAVVRDTFFAGFGVPFCFVRVADAACVDRAALDRSAWSATLARSWGPQVFVYSDEPGEPGEPRRIHARMFAPALGIDEDPATGSAAAALVAALAERAYPSDGELRLRIAQGVALGRPSRIDASALRADGVTRAVRVGGTCVAVAEGSIDVPDSCLER